MSEVDIFRFSHFIKQFHLMFNCILGQNVRAAVAVYLILSYLMSTYKRDGPELFTHASWLTLVSGRLLFVLVACELKSSAIKALIK